MTRRQFAMLSSLAASARAQSGGQGGAAACEEDSHLGNLCGFVAKQAERSTFDMSYLRDEFRDLAKWQKSARAKIFEELLYAPAPVSADAQVIRRVDRGDHIEEWLTFRTSADARVPACILIPKAARKPAPAMVALHDHGGFYLWGIEKILDQDNEHPVLTEYRKTYYGGKSIMRELVRQGYVVIAIDMFYWGERRLLLAGDSEALRNRSLELTARDVSQYNSRSGQKSEMTARALLTAGVSWPGVMMWEDIRTLDYLLTRPEVDRTRVGCVGLSVGGYRSYLLAALDPRIRAAVGVGWMASFAAQIPKHIQNTVGLTFHIAGIYQHMDLPDFSGLIAPRPLMLINGSKDALFEQAGLQSAYRKVERIYAKAKASERQRCLIYDAPHQFNLAMQAEAWAWLKKWI